MGDLGAMGLACPVCSEEYAPGPDARVPRVLPCGHTFCAACVARLCAPAATAAPAPPAPGAGRLRVVRRAEAALRAQAGAVRCPVCRAGVAVPPGGFGKNFSLLDRIAAASPREGPTAQAEGPRAQRGAQPAPDGGGSWDALLGWLGVLVHDDAWQRFCWWWRSAGDGRREAVRLTASGEPLRESAGPLEPVRPGAVLGSYPNVAPAELCQRRLCADPESAIALIEELQLELEGHWEAVEPEPDEAEGILPKAVARSSTGADAFCAKPLAELITKKGRETLQRLMEFVTNSGLHWLSRLARSVDDARKEARTVLTQINSHHRSMEIDIDNVFRRMLLLTKKKRYAALEAVSGQRQMKGLDLVRRDWCDISKEAGQFVIDQILSSAPRDDVATAAYQYLRDLSASVHAGRIELAKFAITKTLAKDPDAYDDVGLRVAAHFLNAAVGKQCVLHPRSLVARYHAALMECQSPHCHRTTREVTLFMAQSVVYYNMLHVVSLFDPHQSLFRRASSSRRISCGAVARRVEEILEMSEYHFVDTSLLISQGRRRRPTEDLREAFEAKCARQEQLIHEIKSIEIQQMAIDLRQKDLDLEKKDLEIMKLKKEIERRDVDNRMLAGQVRALESHPNVVPAELCQCHLCADPKSAIMLFEALDGMDKGSVFEGHPVAQA
eukprot:m51a1_g8383 dna polymerase alpha catalytic subunit, putative (668) ;mRNA; f:185495-193832